ncbi:MAG: glycosyltransferase, partial [Proteobacteria bacterium]|nr:glycosyltransferase [Pseudomonadota bacterium]
QISTMFPGGTNEDFIDGIRIIRGGGELYFNYSLYFLLKKELSKNRYDITIDDINKIPFFSPLYVKMPVLAVIPHIFGKTIYNEVDPISATYVYLSEFPIKRVYRNSFFEVISDSTKNDVIRRGIPEERVKTIVCGIDHDTYNIPSHFKKSQEKTIVYVGRIKKYKSVQHIIRSMPKVLEKADVKLIIVGDGDYRETLEKKLTYELHLEKYVKFTGYVSQAKKVRILREAFISIYPSLIEGWGLVNIEANACGTPVIASNVPGLRDSVKNGESGLLYEYGNIDELASKIVYMLKNKKLYEGFRHGALKWAKQFKWEHTGKETLKYIEKILG